MNSLTLFLEQSRVGQLAYLNNLKMEIFSIGLKHLLTVLDFLIVPINDAQLIMDHFGGSHWRVLIYHRLKHQRARIYMVSSYSF